MTDNDKAQPPGVTAAGLHERLLNVDLFPLLLTLRGGRSGPAAELRERSPHLVLFPPLLTLRGGSQDAPPHVATLAERGPIPAAADPPWRRDCRRRRGGGRARSAAGRDQPARALPAAHIGLACGHAAPRPLAKVQPPRVRCSGYAAGRPTDREIVEAAIDDAIEDDLRSYSARIHAQLDARLPPLVLRLGS